MRAKLGVLVSALVFAGCANNDTEQTLLVRQHVEHFNAHNAPGIGSLTSEASAWYMISGDSISPQAQGTEDIVKGLEQYFNGVPGVRTELEHVHADGSFVVSRERVYWMGSDGEERSQASYGVYEIRDGKILNLWYFDAE